MPMPRQSLNTNPFLFFFLFSFLPCLSSAANDEALALLSWLHSSDQPPSVSSHWNPSDSNPCHWPYITCSSDKYVTDINIYSVELALPFPQNISTFQSLQRLIISGVNLTGSIPSTIGDCTELKVIDVSSNSLVGEIPSSIGRLKKLENLILNSNQFSGQIPAELGECINLKNLLIFDNLLTGNIPTELGKLSYIESIRAGGNKDISGNIPEEIGNCKNLKVLGLAVTKVSGPLPVSIGKLSNLQTLSVYTTMLSGEIPKEIGNCSELVYLFLYENKLSGLLPRELDKLQKLEKILLWQNSFHGPIPEELGYINSLQAIDLSLNYFSGSIPSSFGNLTNIIELMLSNNNISGSIPSVLGNCTSLVQLQLDTNQLTGAIPSELGMLKELNVFFAWQNNLEGNIPGELAGCWKLQALDFSHNALTGSLPPGLFQLQNLTKLLLISNDISGGIPPTIGNCSSLIRLRLAKNRITGEIPREIGFLENLSYLDFSENLLNGTMPEELGNCLELQMLNLNSNYLRGTLPSSLSWLTRLQVLDVSGNQFMGQIPPSFSNLTSLNRLILSKNSISGEIPSTLGHCSNLQLIDLSSNELSGNIPEELFEIEDLDIALNLSWNTLDGIIPSRISALNKLSVLDLSHNELSGYLYALSELDNLVSLNISHNRFMGYLPDSKLFRQLSSKELEGNDGLCSRGFKTCFIGSSTSRNGQKNGSFLHSKSIKITVGLLISLIVVLAVFGVLAMIRARKMIRDGEESAMEGDLWPWQFTPFQKLNFTVEQVLECLVEANVIGKGCSGIVYRAEMPDGEVIAVKKLWPTTIASGYDCLNEKNGRDSFSAEIKTLGSIRHKNIVRFLGCCWNRSTRLLMYDYMPNGSLGSLLHERNNETLEWEIRFKIILGAAQGLAYLHHDCVPPIVHRDIKANNILIGPDLKPYIADFGLAKLVDDGDFARSSSTIAGSYGYIAPEYGYMLKITEKSDVYSFGVLMLEVLTGKQPIDPTIPDGLHIVDWVKRIRGAAVLHKDLQAVSESETEEMLQTLGVALLCVNPSPQDRPTMKDIAAMISEIRQETEELTKPDMSMKNGNRNGDNNNNQEEIGKNASVVMREMVRFTRSNSTSFSGSSLLHSSSSRVKSGHK